MRGRWSRGPHLAASIAALVQRGRNGCAGLALAKQRGAREQHGRHRRRDRKQDVDHQRIERELRVERRKVDDRGKRCTPGGQRVGERGRMHALEKSAQTKEAEGRGDAKRAAGEQQQRDQHFDPEGKRAAHSITSPRSRNFASAAELTKPNSAIRSAATKYMLLAKRIPSTSITSMPFT